MLQLSRHIELLLADNDCVVIPGFGGFITHEMPAEWNPKESIFFPPSRTLGFNPQLKLNDGLLVQSYMKALGNNYARSSEVLENDVKKLTETLRRDGKAEFPHIGCINCLADNRYEFVPYNNELISPSYYGLDSFEIKQLTTLIEENITTEKQKRRRITYPLFLNPLLRNTAAVAVIIIIFFLMSTPIENTYIEEENYANILPTELFDKIKKKSLLTTPVARANDNTQTDQSVIKPVATKEVKVPQPETETTVAATTPEPSEYKYHLIVASVTKEDEGLSFVEKLHTKGYKQAHVITGDGRIRVSIASYATREEATKELLDLRKIDAYQNAWLLTR